jgi:Amt family ammonium transporter
MGFAGGIVCFFAATTMKHAMGYDDSLDAFGVHGVGGTLGAILTGVFAVASVNGKPGLIDGNAKQVVYQLIATVITWLIAAVGSLALLKIVGVLVGGLRCHEDHEAEGLDLTQHGESGYNLEDVYSATFAGGGAMLIDEGRNREAVVTA